MSGSRDETVPEPARTDADWTAALVAPLFVLLWSTGFLGARLGLPYIEPLTFLAIRFAIVAALLGLWVALIRAPAAPRSVWGRIAWIGALVHAVYLGCVFVAMSRGLEAGVAALIAALAPIFTALIAWLRFGEQLTAAQKLGMGLGFVGVALVVARKLDAGVGDWFGAALVVLAAFGFALGAVEQRALGRVPMASGNAIQYLAAALLCALGALALETGAIRWSGELIFALTWLIFVLSVGAISLYYVLLRRGAASKVSSLLFLVPGVTATLAWALFDETLGVLEIAGFAVAALGVALVTKTWSPGAR